MSAGCADCAAAQVPQRPATCKHNNVDACRAMSAGCADRQDAMRRATHQSTRLQLPPSPRRALMRDAPHMRMRALVLHMHILHTACMAAQLCSHGQGQGPHGAAGIDKQPSCTSTRCCLILCTPRASSWGMRHAARPRTHPDVIQQHKARVVHIAPAAVAAAGVAAQAGT